MIRREILEDDANHERWLVSYADFITLLFAFFVVMYAISSVNEGKYRVLSQTLTEAFDQAPRSLEPIQVGDPLLAASPHIVDVPDETGYQDESPGDTLLGSVQDVTPDGLAGIVDAAGVDVHTDNDWVEISLDTSLMFAPASARLTPAAASVLGDTARYLNSFDNALSIEGYTDNIPASGQFSSNWELSSARAATVAEFFVAAGVDRRRLVTVGYGENHPLETNATESGRASNRRVVVVVARRSNLARSLKAQGAGAMAYVRQGGEQSSPVKQLRTETGGLLFTVDPDAEDRVRETPTDDINPPVPGS